MGYSKTKVINKTDNTITLKTGAAGILVKVDSLGPGKAYAVSSDTNSTYREYWAVYGDESPAVFSSDDIAEFKEIIIRCDEHNRCFWEGTVPRSALVPATAGRQCCIL